MNFRSFSGYLAATLVFGCARHHQVEVQSAAFPPPVEAPVLHSSRLWVELSPATLDDQCSEPKLERELCFENIHTAIETSLSQSLWTTFPRVDFLDRADRVRAGDYVLVLDVRVEPQPPDASGPGWSARAKGKWQLVRDGVVLAGEELSVRSRPEFGYGRPLGVGAGEVLDAIGVHIAAVLARLPESRPLAPVPLPAVAARPLPVKPAPGATEAPASPAAAPLAADPIAPQATPVPAASPGPDIPSDAPTIAPAQDGPSASL